MDLDIKISLILNKGAKKIFFEESYQQARGVIKKEWATTLFFFVIIKNINFVVTKGFFNAILNK